MKLKHGKKYETADGTVFKVRKNPIYAYIFDVCDDTYEHWDENGNGSYTKYPNLIRRHYTKPQPAHKLDLKRGDVVELVAWEDGSTAWIGEVFGRQNMPTDFDKGDRPLFRVVIRQAQTS